MKFPLSVTGALLEIVNYGYLFEAFIIELLFVFFVFLCLSVHSILDTIWQICLADEVVSQFRGSIGLVACDCLQIFLAMNEYSSKMCTCLLFMNNLLLFHFILWLMQILKHAKLLSKILLIGPLFIPPVHVTYVAKVAVTAAIDPTFPHGIIDVYGILQRGHQKSI